MSANAKPLSFCAVEQHGPVTLITINRPEVRNALHRPASLELEQVFDRFQADPDAWVAIVTGAGDKAFCAGNDLKYQAGGNDTTWPASGFAGLTGRVALDKPVIAAVNGLALGGGFEIALACDLIVAAAHAEFALPEPHVGLAATAGGLLRLPQANPMIIKLRSLKKAPCWTGAISAQSFAPMPISSFSSRRRSMPAPISGCWRNDRSGPSQRAAHREPLFSFPKKKKPRQDVGAVIGR